MMWWLMYTEKNEQRCKQNVPLTLCLAAQSGSLLAYVWPCSLTGHIGNTGSWGARVHFQTGSTYSNAKYPFEFSRQPLFSYPTLQTNGDEWLSMKASLKYIMKSFTFWLCWLLMESRFDNVSKY